MSEKLFLAGDGLVGSAIASGITAAAVRGLAAAVAIEVKLGRKPPLEKSRAPKLRFYLHAAAAANLPASLDYYTKAAPSLERMMLNDQYGCCVISGKGHNLGVYTGNDSDSGGVAVVSDQEILAEYRRLCGPGDNGCYIDGVLRNMMSGGIKQAGKVRKIDGYASIDWTNADEVKTAILLFGAVTVGFNLPRLWLNQSVWDITNSSIAGGHDVSIVGWLANGNYVVSSWGRLYEWVPRAFNSTSYIDEAYVILAPEWYNTDGMSPSLLDVGGLKRALEAFAAGVVPTVPPPQPIPVPPVPVPPVPTPPVDPPVPVPPIPVPPVPVVPVPPAYSVELSGTLPVGVMGRSVPITLRGTAAPIVPTATYKIGEWKMGVATDIDLGGGLSATAIPFTTSGRSAYEEEIAAIVEQIKTKTSGNVAGCASGPSRGYAMSEAKRLMSSVCFAGPDGEVCVELGTMAQPVGAVPWSLIMSLVAEAVPIMIEAIAGGATWGEAIALVLAILTKRKAGPLGRERILTPEQWAKFFQLVLQILPMFL